MTNDFLKHLGLDASEGRVVMKALSSRKLSLLSFLVRHKKETGYIFCINCDIYFSGDKLIRVSPRDLEIIQH